MEWLKSQAMNILLIIVVGVGGMMFGYQKGQESERVKQLTEQAVVTTAVQEKRDERQNEVDRADDAAALALAQTDVSAYAARAVGDGVRLELAQANSRATRAAAQLTGERKAAAERERVYTRLLDESTRMVEVYAAAADRNYQRGLACEKAWPK